MKGKKPFKKFGGKKEHGHEAKHHSPPEEVKIEQINMEIEGKVVSVSALVERISQTGGPTLFSVTDGTGLIALKGFIGPGERAFPEINESDCVTAVVKIKEYNGDIEGEILRINKFTPDKAEKLKKEIYETRKRGAQALEPEFLVKSPILNKLRNEMIKAATEIRFAVIENRPIIVRHHNDVDGYSSGFVLERAILPLIEKQHGGGKSTWEFFQRAPCQAPYYDMEDSIRDTSNSLRNVAKFSNKMPLIIIADNGSTEQDLMGIKQGKVHGADFIVIDHHPYGTDVISPEVLAHVNPFLVGETGAAFSAGMLCTELARFISDVKTIDQIPAMAGLADRIDIVNPEVIEAYVQIAEEKGYTRELLRDIATVIDYVSAKLRFMEAREYIEVVFGEPREKQRKLVILMAPYIRELESKGLEIAKTAVEHEKIEQVTLAHLAIETTFPGFGFYPKPGKCVSMLHDFLQHDRKINSLITFGIMNSAITFRATDDANFSVGEFIEFLNKKLPECFVEGGGHKNAGSISFVPGKQKDVLKLLREFVKSRNK